MFVNSASVVFDTLRVNKRQSNNPVGVRSIYLTSNHLGDNCIQNFQFGSFSVRYDFNIDQSLTLLLMTSGF